MDRNSAHLFLRRRGSYCLDCFENVWRRFQFSKRLVSRCACVEPPAEQRELCGGWLRFAVGRHVIVVVHRKAEALAHQTVFGIRGIKARTRVATFEQEFNSVHAEAALGFM